MSYLARMLILRYSITHVRAKVTAYLRFHAHKSRPHLTIAGGQCEVAGLLALCFFDLRQAALSSEPRWGRSAGGPVMSEVALPNMLVVKSQRLTLEFRSGALGLSSSF